PLVSITTPTGIAFATIALNSTGAFATLDGTTCAQTDAEGVCQYIVARGELDDDELLLAAVRASATTRFRYDIGSAAIAMGTWRLSFASGAIRNADLVTDGGTTPGAQSAATQLTFT